MRREVVAVKVIRKGLMGVAVIDPQKKVDEPGQYESYKGSEIDLAKIIVAAKITGCEIRWYYKDLITLFGEVVPAKVIVTEIPPGHIQPFHTHDNVHEITVVDEGSIMAVDSNDLKEEDRARLLEIGVILNQGDMVIEDPNVRHTVLNHTRDYATMTTVQVARIPIEKFSADWNR